MTNPNDSIEPIWRSASDPEYAQYGLTKREHFAAMAMQGMLANGVYKSDLALAVQAVAYADALIEALNAPKP